MARSSDPVIEQKIGQAWAFTFDRLMHPATDQIYDYRTGEGPDGAWRHLAAPAEIAASVPNPCGWYAGMENTDINGGVMLDGLLCRYSLTKDGELIPFARRLYRGLMRNAQVSAQEGFLARGVLPSDGKTHYINSSRDQYTHWICAMLRYFRSPLCTDEQKKEIAAALCAFARKAERDVTAENEWCLLREDGRPALVCEMLGKGVAWHESNRLPMIYMAAYAASGDAHWKEAYLALREQTLAFAEEIRFDTGFFKNAFALLQMQLSLRLLYDCEEDEPYRARYLRLMRRVTAGAEQYPPQALDYLSEHQMPRFLPSWRNCPADFVRDAGVSHGLAVIRPNVWRAGAGAGWWMLHNVADAILAQAYCPGRRVAQSQIDLFMRAVRLTDFENAFSDHPVAFCAAYYALAANEASQNDPSNGGAVEDTKSI